MSPIDVAWSAVFSAVGAWSAVFSAVGLAFVIPSSLVSRAAFSS